MVFKGKQIFIDWLPLWILFSAWSVLSGWILSMLRHLDRSGMAVSYSLFLAAVILCRSQLQCDHARDATRIFRSRHWLPRIWLFLAALAFIGGMAYAPNNYDYLTYRFPRVLNWSWAHGWYWIPTTNERLNYSGAGFEWLMAPAYIVFRSDRLFFLINFISYLFLPGLIFSVFNGLGIRKRISWWWMWILPCGYCFILQAASAGNDSVAAVYGLAALHYLLRTKSSSALKQMVFSSLAIALMTGVKAANLPLVLPWMTLLVFRWNYFKEHCKPLAVGVVFTVAATVSFLPLALLNTHFTGDYAGDPNNGEKMKISNPIVGILANSLQLTKDNLAPPILPRSVDWERQLPPRLKAKLLGDFPRLDLRWGELQMEETAGLGVGIILCLGLFIAEGIRARFAAPGLIAMRSTPAVWVAGATAISLIVYMAKLGSESTARLVAAYYPLLVAAILVLVSLDGTIVRRRLFNRVGIFAMLTALPLVVLSPARPLFPVQVISRLLAQSHLPADMIARFHQVYSVYAARSDAFKELAEAVPPGVRVIGLLQNGDVPEVSLWRPFGSREVIDLTPQDSAQQVKASGIHFIFVSRDALANRYHTTVTLLAAKWSASLVTQKSLTLSAHKGPETWYFLSL
jgi:hypothetical protein